MSLGVRARTLRQSSQRPRPVKGSSRHVRACGASFRTLRARTPRQTSSAITRVRGTFGEKPRRFFVHLASLAQSGALLDHGLALLQASSPCAGLLPLPASVLRVPQRGRQYRYRTPACPSQQLALASRVLVLVDAVLRYVLRSVVQPQPPCPHRGPESVLCCSRTV